MQMNALRSANLVKLSSSNATSDEYWLTSMSDGTPGGYCLSQIRSMGLSPRNFGNYFASRRMSGMALFPAVLAMRQKMASGCALSTHRSRDHKSGLAAQKPLKIKAGCKSGAVAN